MAVLLIAGYYKVPDYTKTVLQIAGKSDKIITSPESLVIVDDNETKFGKTSEAQEPPTATRQTLESILQNEEKKTDERKQNSFAVQTDKERDGAWERFKNSTISFYFSRDFIKFAYGAARLWLNQQENKGLKLTLIVLVGCIVAMFWYFTAQVIEIMVFLAILENIFGLSTAHKKNYRSKCI
jgi:serine/threonine-protein kinase/endoribonuclease IRE1